MTFPASFPFTFPGGPSTSGGSGTLTGEEQQSPEWGEGPWPGVHPSSTDETKFKRPEWLQSIPNFLHWLVEHILRAIVQAITGIFVNGPLGSAFTQLQEFGQRLEDRFGNIRDALEGIFGFDFLEGGLDPIAAITRLIDNFIPLGRLAELHLGKLKAGQEPQQLLDMLNISWGEVFGDDNAIDKTIDDFRDAIASLKLRAANASDLAQTGINLFNFPLSQPIWGHTNPTMHVPLGFLHLRKFSASGSVVSTASDPESIAVTQTASAGVFNRFDRSLDVDLATFRAKATGTITAFTLHIWRMDAVTGIKTWIRSDAINPAGLPTASFDNVYIPFSAPVHADAGTVLAGEATITGSGTLAISGVTVPWLTDDLSARPRRPGFSRAVNAGATPPATIADVAVGYNTTVPNIALGQSVSALPAPKYTYAESFDGGVGQWTAKAGILTFTGGVLKTGTSGSNAAMFNLPTYGDKSRVAFELRATWNALSGGFGDGDKIRLIGWATNTLSQYVAIEIESNLSVFSALADHHVRIVTGTSVLGTPTVRSTDATIAHNYGGTLAIEYDVATNTYSLFIGNATTPTKTWADSGNVITHGPDYRQAAIYAALSGSGLPICDNFSYRDV